jgi:hypothetical protein
MKFNTLRLVSLLGLTTVLALFNVSCADVPKATECEKRVIVYFLQPVTAEQGLEIVKSVLAPSVNNGLGVYFRTQVNAQTLAYSLSAAGCGAVDQGIETLRQAQGTKIRLLEMDARVYIQK